MGDVYRAFVGSIPHFYDLYLVPLIFEPYAADLAARVPVADDTRVLELACGTGAMTQLLARRLGQRGRLTASDLNPGMIEIARAKVGDDARVTWQQIDATSLPFEDDAFDAIACQFGCMFFPDRPRAMREAQRVLRSGGKFAFNTWDRLAACPVFAEAEAEIRACFPGDPPRFYEIPFGMYDTAAIERLMRDAGFREIAIERIALSGAKLEPKEIATGIIRGGPFVTEIEQRGGDVDAVVGRAAKRIESKFGSAPLASPMNAWVCTAVAP